MGAAWLGPYVKLEAQCTKFVHGDGGPSAQPAPSGDVQLLVQVRWIRPTLAVRHPLSIWDTACTSDHTLMQVKDILLLFGQLHFFALIIESST